MKRHTVWDCHFYRVLPDYAQADTLDTAGAVARGAVAPSCAENTVATDAMFANLAAFASPL